MDCERFELLLPEWKSSSPSWLNFVEFVDDQHLIVGSEFGVELLEMKDGVIYQPVRRADVAATCIDVHEGLIAVGASDFKVWILDTQLRIVGRLLHSDYVNAVQFDSTGERLYAGGRDNEVSVWPASYWQGQSSIAFASSSEPAVAISDQGRIATYHAGSNAESAAYVRIWNPEGG